MKPDKRERDLIFRLLKENSTFGETTHFLKSRKLHFSAPNWEALISERLEPAVEDGRLSREDLIGLLRVSEEHGRQHVFLYRAPKSDIQRLIDVSTVTATLREMHLDGLLKAPRVLDLPTNPTIVDVRWEKEGNEATFIMKVVEQRVYQRFLDKKVEDGLIIVRYRETKERAVNLFRLWSSGLLELRIYSHLNSSDYKADVSKMWLVGRELLSKANFKEISITKAKSNLWKGRKGLAGIVRFSDSRLANPAGTTLSAATGSEEGNLFDDTGATKSLDEFLAYQGFCESSNVWWLRRHPSPTKDVHVLLSGATNEFVVTAQCLKEDYEYVLGEIQRHNG